MLNRNKEVLLWLNEEEFYELKDNARKCGMSVQRYLRMLLKNIQPKEFPPVDYFDVLTNLRQINVNMNQIAVVANKKGFIDVKSYWDSVSELQRCYGLLKNLTI